MGCWPTAPCTTLAWRSTGSSTLSIPEPVSTSLGSKGQDWDTLLTPPSFHSLHLPPVLPVAEDSDPTHYVAGGSLPHLGAVDCPLEVSGL